MTAILQFRDVRIDYQVREGLVRSVDGVTLDVERGGVTAVIGESGSGKTTLSNAVLGLVAPNGKIHASSEIRYEGENLLALAPEALRRFRWRKASLVFQAAQNALNPTLTVRRQLLDTVADHGDDPRRAPYPERLAELMAMVRLDPARVLDSYPHQLSGGMRQRLIIALALILAPELVILDEPTTALDVITQSYVMDILQDIHAARGLTMLFITHDLAAVARMADRVAVMYAGAVVEAAPAEAFFARPRHPYGQGLLASIPSIEGDAIRRKPIDGQPPDLIHKPPGCVFHPRCPHAQAICREVVPVLDDAGVACHLWREIS